MFFQNSANRMPVHGLRLRENNDITCRWKLTWKNQKPENGHNTVFAVFHKNSHFVFWSQLRQMNTDFRNSSTGRFRRKFSIDMSWRLPPHLSCVATLPCEIWESIIFVFQKQTLPLLIICFIPPSLWPLNSPDLNPVDYTVWGSYKSVCTSTTGSRTWKSCASVSMRNGAVWTRILYRLWDIAFDRSKIALFLYPLVFNTPGGGVPVGWSP